jgi:hypothetical protein
MTNEIILEVGNTKINHRFETVKDTRRQITSNIVANFLIHAPCDFVGYIFSLFNNLVG